MRCIDGDVLFREMEKAQWYNNADRDEIAEELVLNAPTIEPQCKKGTWIPQNLNKSDGMISTAVYYYPKCSVCGANANYTNFCPNCGADMREDGERA